MSELERERFRDGRLRAAHRRLGSPRPVCVICGYDKPHGLEREHPAGRKHDDTTIFMCRNCHAERSERQREQPRGGADPRNVFEVLGRWLLSMAEYFELIIATLRRFGEFLIGLARQGYGSEFTVP
jgi:hypothetical protein